MEVSLLDLTGHVILHRICSGEDRYTFNLDDLTQGSYTVRLKTDTELLTRKIVIIR